MAKTNDATEKALSANEVREHEGLPPIPGGDEVISRAVPLPAAPVYVLHEPGKIGPELLERIYASWHAAWPDEATRPKLLVVHDRARLSAVEPLDTADLDALVDIVDTLAACLGDWIGSTPPWLVEIVDRAKHLHAKRLGVDPERDGNAPA